MSVDLELELITHFVEQDRIRCNITPTYGAKFELSCEAFGEGANLYRQLLLTVNGCEYWETISRDAEQRKLVLDYIRHEQRRMQNKTNDQGK